MADPFGSLMGKQFGNYRLTRLLGQGGFASVYLGEHIHLNTSAAIKLLHASMTKNETDRFFAEARMISNLDHPHIVRMIDFGLDDTTPYLIMPYAPNGSLRTLHREGTALPLATAVLYVRQIALGLQYAHDHRLVHRDVKPENILLGPQNKLWLSDFGIALVTRTSHQQSTKDTVGTIAYMAPEQSMGKPVAASDQYALGIMTYEWLVGVRPFVGTYSEVIGQHLSARPPSICARVPSISPAIEQVVMRALAKDPRQRFPSVKAFADALKQAYMIGSVTISPAAPTGSQPHSSPRQARAIPPIVSPPVVARPTQTSHAAPQRPVTEVPENIPPQQGRQTIPQHRPVGGMQTSPTNRPPYHGPQPYMPPPVQYVQVPSIATVPQRKPSSKGWLIAITVAAAILILPILLCGWIGATSVLPGISKANTPVVTRSSVTPTPLPVTNNILYNADWSKDANGWTDASEWKWVEGGALESTGHAIGEFGPQATDFTVLSPYKPTTDDYVVEAQIQLIRFSSNFYTDFGIVVRSADDYGYACVVTGDSKAEIAFPNIHASLIMSTPLDPHDYKPDNNFHTFRVEAKSDHITMSIDGKVVSEATDSSRLTGGAVGLRANQTAIKVLSFQVLPIGS